MHSSIRGWSMACHLSSFLLLLGIPLGNVIGPFVIWLCKRHEHPWLYAHATAALNFQLSMTLYLLVAGALTFLGIGFILLPIVIITDLVCASIAAFHASKNHIWRYPLTIRFIQ